MGTDRFILRERTVGDVTVLDLQGDFMIGSPPLTDKGTSPLMDKVDAFIQLGKLRVLLNVELINYVDNAGLGEFVRCYTTLQRHGGKLKFLRPSGSFRNLVGIVPEVNDLFEIFDDERAAIESFQLHERPLPEQP